MAIITGTLASVEAADVAAMTGTAVAVGVVEQQSAAFDIRNAFYNLVTADPFFAGYTARKTKMLPVQQDLLPYLGIYLVDEIMEPDGDANAACVRFTHTARIGFSVMAINNDQDVLEQTIDQAFLKIIVILFTNPQLMNVLQSIIPENYRIESIVRGTRRFVFGSAAFNNEMPLGELRYEISCFYRSEWYPTITDMLDTVNVTTGFKPGDTAAEQEQRQQVNVVYNLNTPPLEMLRVLRQHMVKEKTNGDSQYQAADARRNHQGTARPRQNRRLVKAPSRFARRPHI